MNNRRYQEGSFQQFWRRDHLISNNLPLDAIKDLYLHERMSFKDAQSQFTAAEQTEQAFQESGDNFCNSHVYIKCKLDLAFQYCANIFSLEEWSFGIREIQEFRGGLYCGNEKSAGGTEIYLRCEAYSECRSIDQLRAWDQGNELWMRHYFRLVDAKQSLNKPGTLVTRVSVFHPFYSRTTQDLPEFIQSSQNRPEREWIGDDWRAFCVRQKIEMYNLKKILETRFGDS